MDKLRSTDKKRTGRPQMADIARLAGVSISTVSRALSGNPMISAETSERIAEIASAMNFTADANAQNLRRADNKTVAVVIPYEAESHQNISDPFFLSMLGCLADTFTRRGYRLLLSRVDVSELESIASYYLSRAAMGVVLIGQWGRHEQLNALAVRGIPLVVWGAAVQQQLYCTVGGDNLDGGYQATKHLLERGCRRILFVGDPNLQEVANRLAGYQRALGEAGLPTADAHVLRAPFDGPTAVELFQERYQAGERFDGLFACSDVLAVTLMRHLQGLGMNVPHDVRVVGYDDVDWAVHATPPLTTIKQPIALAAEQIADKLLAQVAGEPALPATLPVELVIRATT